MQKDKARIAVIGTGWWATTIHIPHLQKHPDAVELQRNTVRDNQFGLGGRDLNGRDVIYDGSGTGNCFGPQAYRSPTVPADTAALPSCPFAGKNAYSPSDRLQMIGWTGEGAVNGWITHTHVKKKGIKPLVIWKGKQG